MISVMQQAAWISAVAQDTAAATPAAPSSTTVWEYIRHSGVVGVVLIGLSVAAVTLVIMAFIRLRMSAWAPAAVVAGLGRLLRDHDIEGARRFCADPAHECFVSNVVGLALARCSRSVFGFLELRTALEEAGQVEVDRQYRPLEFIGLIAALGPMLGLLGTVFGLIGAFGTLASAAEGAARSKELAGFMSLALVNTAQGLAVAIPCTAFYAFFRRRADRLATEAALLIEELAMPLEGKQGATKAAAGRAPSRPAAPAMPAAGPAMGAGPASAGVGTP